MNWEKEFYGYWGHGDGLIISPEKLNDKIKSLVSKEIKEIIGKDRKLGEVKYLVRGLDSAMNEMMIQALEKQYIDGWNKSKAEQRKLAKKRGWDI